MDQIEGALGSVLAQVDQFYGGVKQILTEDGPVGTKVEKAKQMWEFVQREVEALLQNVEQAAQDREKELMDHMARLQQLRDNVTFIRHCILPTLALPPQTD